MKELQLTKAPELEVVEKSKAEQIQKTFDPMSKMLKDFENAFDEIMQEAEEGEITNELSDKARVLRISIAKVRTTTEKVRKREKEEYLRAGKAIDGVANILKWAISEKEQKLKDIEDFHERIEQERLMKLQFERHEMIKPYIGDDYIKGLAEMNQEVFEAFLDKKKRDYNDRIEAEKQAERKRIKREKAEKAEQERIRKENEKLKKEAEEREKKAKLEAEQRDKEEKERQAKAEAERKAREEKERKDREAHEAQLAKERAEREKVQKELEAKEESERKAKEEQERQNQLELKKGDTDKVNDLINDLKSLKTKYTFKSKEFQKKYTDTCVLIDKVINHIEK